MERKYLDDINYDHEEVYHNATEKRLTEFKVERAIYGFDSSDTWNLDMTMTAMLYERLMMLRERSIVDYSARKETINNETKTVEEWLDKMIELCEQSLIPMTDDEWDEKKISQNILQLWEIWSKVVLSMWW